MGAYLRLGNVQYTPCQLHYTTLSYKINLKVPGAPPLSEKKSVLSSIFMSNKIGGLELIAGIDSQNFSKKFFTP